MKTAPFVVAGSGLLCALSSSSFAQTEVEEVVHGPALAPGFSVSKTGMHVALQVPKGSRCAFRIDASMAHPRDIGMPRAVGGKDEWPVLLIEGGATDADAAATAARAKQKK